MDIVLDRIEKAAATIDPQFTNSPQFKCESLNRELRRQVLLKVETVNPIRSFKGRGASWFAQRFAEKSRRVTCASAGNFGQAVAYCGMGAGLKVRVVAPETANPLKLHAIRQFGADLILHGHDFDAAKSYAMQMAQDSGGYFLEDGRAPAIAEGAGTIAVELLRRERLDAIYVPVGNGSLICGIAAWIKAKSPKTQVIGICPETAPSMVLSWREGRVVNTERADTIADGLAVRRPVKEAIDYMRVHVDDMMLVSEARMLDAMRLVFRHTGLLIEPSGAAGLAGIMEESRDHHLTCAILCGGTMRPELMKELL